MLSAAILGIFISRCSQSCPRVDTKDSTEFFKFNEWQKIPGNLENLEAKLIGKTPIQVSQYFDSEFEFNFIKDFQVRKFQNKTTICYAILGPTHVHKLLYYKHGCSYSRRASGFIFYYEDNRLTDLKGSTSGVAELSPEDQALQESAL